MTTKLVQDGNTINYTATGDGAAGNLQVVGALLCQVPVTFTTGDGVALNVEGVYTATKVSEAASALVQGQVCYYRVTGGVPKITGKATGGTVAGTAWAAAVTGATTGILRLKGHDPAV